MHCVARVLRVVASGVEAFAKANILISVGLRSAPPNLRLRRFFCGLFGNPRRFSAGKLKSYSFIPC
ncbi:hypothetical protein [uncultured Nostoc sp.]|uniref:hypothetical protein n=1 Tax=uncultured Nostoc sp. TaxID=340711 RepID=UPI0035CAA335|nr:hypothetical protein [Nostoc sp. NMS8]